MKYIDKKTFDVMAIGIKGILNVAKSVDSSELLKNISKEIEVLLDSVQDKEVDNSQKLIKPINISNVSTIKEVIPTQVVKPLV